MKLLPRIWISLAIGLMFGHNMVAHSHTPVYELNLCQQEPSMDLFHIIQHVFSIDQGSDHLKHFEIRGNYHHGFEKDGNHNFMVAHYANEFPLNTTESSCFVNLFICRTTKTPIDSSPLRAPPVV